MKQLSEPQRRMMARVRDHHECYVAVRSSWLRTARSLIALGLLVWVYEERVCSLSTV